MDSYRYPRPYVFAGFSFIMAIAHFLLCMFWSQGALYVSVILAGSCYGAMNTLNPGILSEVFGLKHMGSVYSTAALNISVGGFSLATFLAGGVFDAHADPTGVPQCLGLKCYEVTMLVCAGVCVLSSISQLLLGRRELGRYLALYGDGSLQY